MANFNKVILCGNVTRDLDLRYLPKGTATTRVGLAVSRKWKDDSGNPHEEVLFIDCDLFGRAAEVVHQHVRKGMPLLVEGRLRLDEWTDKNTGEPRHKMGISVETFQMLGFKKTESAQPEVQP